MRQKNDPQITQNSPKNLVNPKKGLTGECSPPTPYCIHGASGAQFSSVKIFFLFINWLISSLVYRGIELIENDDELQVVHQLFAECDGDKNILLDEKEMGNLNARLYFMVPRFGHDYQGMHLPCYHNYKAFYCSVVNTALGIILYL